MGRGEFQRRRRTTCSSWAESMFGERTATGESGRRETEGQLRTKPKTSHRQRGPGGNVCPFSTPSTGKMAGHVEDEDQDADRR